MKLALVLLSVALPFAVHAQPASTAAPAADETRSRAAVLQAGGVTVELVQHDDAVPLRTNLQRPRWRAGIHGIFKVGMTIDSFDEAVAALTARRVDMAFGPFPSRDDQPANIMIERGALVFDGLYEQLHQRR